MRKGIKLKAMFSDEEKSLKRFRNYEIEDLGQDGTVYLKNDKRKLLSFPPNNPTPTKFKGSVTISSTNPALFFLPFKASVNE